MRYVPGAIVFNRGPEVMQDFIRQRRRIYAGHPRVRAKLGYAASTMRIHLLVRALLTNWRWNWRHICWTPAVVLPEIYGRFLGWTDYRFRKPDHHTVWEVAVTTKGAVK